MPVHAGSQGRRASVAEIDAGREEKLQRGASTRVPAKMAAKLAALNETARGTTHERL
jgi:hypothetical protein